MSNKEPWGEGSPWKNSVAFFTYLRGCLRKTWSNNPIKHIVIKKSRYQIDNPNPNGKKKTVWGFMCGLCKKEYVILQGQVDHINPAGSLRKTEDIQGFVERLLYVTEDDLRLICKGCNSALGHSDRTGMSYDDSIVEKLAISIIKSKQDKQWLSDHGLIPASNEKARRQQITKYLKENPE